MTTHSMKWLLEQLEVYLVFFDQCASGLSVSPEGLSRKSSACVSNHPGLLHEMSKLKCAGDHVHVPLQGGLPAKAQEYPVGLLRAMLKGILLTLDRNDKKHHSYGEFDEDEEQRLGGEEDPDDEDLGFRLRAPQTPSPAINQTSSRHPKAERIDSQTPCQPWSSTSGSDAHFIESSWCLGLCQKVCEGRVQMQSMHAAAASYPSQKRRHSRKRSASTT